MPVQYAAGAQGGVAAAGAGASMARARSGTQAYGGGSHGLRKQTRSNGGKASGGAGSSISVSKWPGFQMAV